MAGKAFGTFQLHYQRVFDQNIGKVFSNRTPLVHHGKRNFCGSPHAAESEFSKQCPLVNLFEKSRPQCVRNLEHSA